MYTNGTATNKATKPAAIASRGLIERRIFCKMKFVRVVSIVT
jgi:hypothetical protein